VIQGIEILNEVTQMPAKSSSTIAMYIIFAVLFLACACMCAWCIYSAISDTGGYVDGGLLGGMIVLFIFFVGCCVGDYFMIKAIIPETKRRETIVYATIEESVPWIVVNEKYELVQQDGKIYTLRVREPNATD
jgi:hypothetical protein